MVDKQNIKHFFLVFILPLFLVISLTCFLYKTDQLTITQRLEDQEIILRIKTVQERVKTVRPYITYETYDAFYVLYKTADNKIDIISVSQEVFNKYNEVEIYE